MKKTIKYIIGFGVIVAIMIFFVASRDSSNTGNSIKKDLTPIDSISHGHGLAIDAVDQNKVYIATHHGLLVLMNEKDLFQVGQEKDDYMGFSAHPTDPNVFFSSGHPSTGGNIGFQKSEDGGFTWEKISDGLNDPVDFHAMAVSPVNPDLVFGWYRGDLQRTTDGGKTWSKFSVAFPIVNLAADTKDENIVYAATPMGLQKSIDKGQTWKLVFDGFVSTIGVDPKDSQHLLSFSEKLRLAKSNDGGTTWEKLNESFNSETPLFFSFYRQNPDIVYLLTEKNSLYKSVDGGNLWNKIR